MAKRLYWGDNESHQFWESEDHELLILRVHGESFWTAHRNHGFLFSCKSVEEGARRIEAELSGERVWRKQGDGKFALMRATGTPKNLKGNPDANKRR